MSAAEFFEFMIYEQMEPFGDRRGDIHAGQIQATLANIHRNEKTRPYKIEDFMLQWEPKTVQPQQADTQLQMMLALQAMQNTKVSGSA